MKTLISWLGDVYQKNGYIAVLVVVAAIVGLALVVAQVGGISIGDIVAWIGGL
jgi:hypothetical protein